MRQRLSQLNPSAQEKAEADFIVADSDMKAWDPHGTDDGANRAARVKATNAMMQFYDSNRTSLRRASTWSQAAYNVARMRQATDMNSDEWRQKTIAAFEKYRGSAAQRRQERSDGIARGRHGRRVRVRDGR